MFIQMAQNDQPRTPGQNWQTNTRKGLSEIDTQPFCQQNLSISDFALEPPAQPYQTIVFEVYLTFLTNIDINKMCKNYSKYLWMKLGPEIMTWKFKIFDRPISALLEKSDSQSGKSGIVGGEVENTSVHCSSLSSARILYLYFHKSSTHKRPKCLRQRPRPTPSLRSPPQRSSRPPSGLPR